MTPASRPLPVAQPSSFSELHDTGMSFASGNSISSPLVPLKGSRLSPANISYEANNHTGLYTAKRGQENDALAFIQLIHKCRQLEEELTKEREAHNLLKATHGTLIETNKILAVMLADSQKRPRIDDREPGSGPPNTLSQQTPIAARDGATSSALLHADYPKVKYWTKQAWEDAERKRKKRTRPE